jgi:myo-inositol 2-dehydrogenase/D-chiro-inositol 1-dehydrogenase
VESVRTEMPTLVGVNDARPPLVIGLAAKRSLDEGRPIPVAEVEASAVGRPG